MALLNLSDGQSNDTAPFTLADDVVQKEDIFIHTKGDTCKKRQIFRPAIFINVQSYSSLADDFFVTAASPRNIRCNIVLVGS